MRLKETTPPDLVLEQWENETILVLGAPYVGKSHLFKNSEGVTRVTTIPAALNMETSEYIVVDEFYRAYQAASADQRDEFVAWLHDTKEVCISARPRAFDWLLEQDDTKLPENIVNAFNAVYHIRFDPEADRDTAIECCLQIGGSDEDGLDRDAVDAHIEKVLSCRTYRFKNQALRDTVGTEKYSTTLVPGLVAYFSDQLEDASEAFVSQSIVSAAKEFGREFLENAALTDLINRTSVNELFSVETWEAIRERLSGQELPTEPLQQAADSDVVTKQGEGIIASASSSLVPFLGPAAAGGGILAIWLKLHQDDGLDTEDVFDVLTSEELTPTARFELERELNLPPRTIDNFRRLTQGSAIEQLLQYREQIDSELNAVRDDVSDIEVSVEEQLRELESQIERYEEDLSVIQQSLSTLKSNGVEAEIYASFISTSIQDAVWNIDTWINYEKEALKTYLQNEHNIGESGSIDTIIKDLYHGDSLREDKLREFINNEPRGVAIIKGPSGIGKTRFLQETARILDSRGYSTGFYNSEQSIEFVEQALQERARSDQPMALFCTYNDIPNEWSPAIFRNFFGERLAELVDLLVVECNDAHFPELEESWERSTGRNRYAQHQYARRVEPDELLELGPVDEIDPIPAALGINDDKHIQAISEASEGNPAIAIEAALLVKSRGIDSIAEVTQQDLLKKRLQGYIDFFNGVADGRIDPRSLIETLALISPVPNLDVLTAIAGVRPEDRPEAKSFIKETMDGYVYRRSDSWALKPDIYRPILIEQAWFSDLYTDPDFRVEIALEHINRITAEYPVGLYGCIDGLLLIWKTNPIDIENQTGQASHLTVVDAINAILRGFSEIEDSRPFPWVTLSVYRLSSMSIPFDPAPVLETIDAQLIGSKLIERFYDSNYDSANHILRTLSHCALIYLSNDDHDGFEIVCDTADTLSQRLASEYPTVQQSNYLENFYASICSSIFEVAISGDTEGGLPKRHKKNLTQVITEARRQGESVPRRAEIFLRNFLSMTLVRAIRRTTPDHGGFCFEVIDGQIQNIAADQDDPVIFTAGFYAELIFEAAELGSPTDIGPWEQTIDQHILNVANTSSIPSREFLSKCHSQAIARIAAADDIKESGEWLNKLVNQINQQSKRLPKADNISTGGEAATRSTYLFNFFSKTIGMLATKSSPAAVEVWIDAIDSHAIEIATSNSITQPGFFLMNYYSSCIEKFVSRDVEKDVDEWINRITNRAWNSHDATDTPLEIFHIQIFANAVYQISLKEPFAESGSWLAKLEQRADHFEYEIDSEHDSVIAAFYSYIFQKYSDINTPANISSDWPEYVINHAMAQFDPSDIQYFYQFSTVIISKTKYSEQWQEWISLQLLEYILHNPRYYFSSSAISVEFVAKLTILPIATHVSPDGTLNTDAKSIRQIQDQINQLESGYPEIRRAVISEIATILEEEHNEFVASTDWRLLFDDLQ